MKRILLIAGATGATLLAVLHSACGGNQLLPGAAVSFTPDEIRRMKTLSPLPPPPADPTNAVSTNTKAAALGQRLFFDPRLSSTGTVSCATCHDPATGFTSRKKVAEGLGRTTRNAPTLLNASHNRWQFWDGRADTLWAQALEPLEAANEMGTTRLAIARLIRSDARLRQAYEDVFGPLPGPLLAEGLPAEGRPVPEDPGHAHQQAWVSLAEETREAADRLFSNVGKSIAAYERLLESRDSAFDRFVEGVRSRDRARISAFPAAAQRGLKHFVADDGCTLCHSGPTLTDREFHNVGLSQGKDLPIDEGRHAGIRKLLANPFNGLSRFSDARDETTNRKIVHVVQKPNNLGEMKTPSLRSVALTAPYLHDGRLATLTDVLLFDTKLDDVTAIGHREETLKPLALTEADIADLVAFLETLTGAPLPKALVTRPD